MNNFEKVAASPGTLGAFLASLPIATGPWDESFHRVFCDSCKQDKRQDCGTPHCPHEDKRNNPTWWLTQEAEPKPEMIAAPENPLRVHIRVLRNGSPLGEIWNGENTGTRLEAAWQTVEEVKKVHPNAEISIEVEV